MPPKKKTKLVWNVINMKNVEFCILAPLPNLYCFKSDLHLLFAFLCLNTCSCRAVRDHVHTQISAVAPFQIWSPYRCLKMHITYPFTYTACACQWRQQLSCLLLFCFRFTRSFFYIARMWTPLLIVWLIARLHTTSRYEMVVGGWERSQ